MAKWQRTLKLQPEWGQCRDNEISVQELSASIAKKLAALKPLADEDLEYERKQLVEQFEDLRDTESADVDDIDDLMSDLYDWGDTRLDEDWNGKKVCWVDTVSQP